MSNLICLCSFCMTPSSQSFITVAATDNRAYICDLCSDAVAEVVKNRRDEDKKKKNKHKRNPSA